MKPLVLAGCISCVLLIQPTAALSQPPLKMSKSYEAHEAQIRALAISPDGKRLYVGGQGTEARGTVKGGWNAVFRVVETETGKTVDEVAAHGGGVFAIVLTPDGKQIITCGGDNLIKIYDLESLKLQKTLEGHRDLVYRMAISPDGKFLASGSYDNTVRIWDLETGRTKHEFKHKNRVSAIDISPDGTLVACGDWDGKVTLRNITTGKLVKTFDDLERLGDPRQVLSRWEVADGLGHLRGSRAGLGCATFGESFCD